MPRTFCSGCKRWTDVSYVRYDFCRGQSRLWNAGLSSSAPQLALFVSILLFVCDYQVIWSETGVYEHLSLNLLEGLYGNRSELLCNYYKPVSNYERWKPNYWERDKKSENAAEPEAFYDTWQMFYWIQEMLVEEVSSKKEVMSINISLVSNY